MQLIISIRVSVSTKCLKSYYYKKILLISSSYKSLYIYMRPKDAFPKRYILWDIWLYFINHWKHLINPNMFIISAAPSGFVPLNISIRSPFYFIDVGLPNHSIRNRHNIFISLPIDQVIPMNPPLVGFYFSFYVHRNKLFWYIHLLSLYGILPIGHRQNSENVSPIMHVTPINISLWSTPCFPCWVISAGIRMTQFMFPQWPDDIGSFLIFPSIGICLPLLSIGYRNDFFTSSR